MKTGQTRKDWNYGYKPEYKQPITPPTDVSQLCSLYSSKLNCTFYGPCKDDCNRQMVEALNRLDTQGHFNGRAV